MNIHSIIANIPFKSATININAFSDSHGHIELADKALQSMIENDCFEKEEKGKANYLITAGDFFISGDKKGFLTDPMKHLAMFQLDFFNKMISEVKKIAPKCNVIFTPGNHELDGGEEIFKDIISNIDAKVIATNLDFKNSHILDNEIEENKIVESCISFVDDDKDENKKYAVLNIAAMPFNMQYYTGNTKEINFLDNIFKPQKKITDEDYQNSFAYINKKIDDFKEKYPEGIVILSCHTGTTFVEDCAKTGKIDLIFDAHLHEEKERQINNTPVISLSQNFKKISNVKIKIDDEGNITKDFKTIRPLNNELVEGNMLTVFYNNLFIKDYKKIYTIKSTDDSIKELSVQNIRNSNNHLANFIVDAILSEIKKYNPKVDIFALNASSIRGGFKLDEGKNVSNFEVLNCLNGIQRRQGNIVINKLKGKDLIKMVIDNILFNSIDTEKNPLFHYSGLTINKTAILNDWDNGKSIENLYKYIIFEKTGEPIVPDKTYRIANTEKYFIKTQNPFIKDFYQKAKPLNKNVLDLFNNYFENNSEIIYEPKTRFY